MSERSVNGIRQFYTAALMPNGKVLIAGGQGPIVNGKLQILSSTLIYDPSQDTFADGPSMGSDRWVATAAPLANGKMLILGGNGDGINVLNSVEVYDSLTNSFTTGAPMSDPRLFGTATLLPDGRVLIAGGWNGTSSLTSTELYPP
jgi:N-acetylneuraminic acid mutarotase